MEIVFDNVAPPVGAGLGLVPVVAGVAFGRM